MATSAGPRSLHVVPSLRLSSGGPTESVTRLCEALNALGAPAEIATVASPGDEAQPPANTPLHTFPSARPSRLRRSPALRTFLDAEAGRFDVVHVHALWQLPCVYGRRAALRHEKPLVISPRGMLEPWSLRQSALLKRLALSTWEGRNLEAAWLLHATSEDEARHFHMLGLKQDICVIPNGVQACAELASDNPSDTKTLLFLSRYHPKKGLDLLLRAWANLAADFPEWRLLVHGPDPDDYKSEVKALAKRLFLKDDQVVFGDAVQGRAKDDLYSRTDLFILPTHSENFGNVVAEALAHGVPVITTTGAPWEGLLDHACGWWVPPTADALESALKEALARPASERRAMGERGRIWMLSSHSWGSVAKRMVEAYQALLTK